MAKFELRFASSRYTWIAASAFAASLLVLGATARKEPRLAATGGFRQMTDLDNDGLSDLYEQVLGTQPGTADSDGDGYQDLEERARGSDPLDAASLPGSDEFGMSLGAYQQGVMVKVLAAIYSNQSRAGDLRLEFGVVYHGQVLGITPSTFGTAHAFRVQAKNPQDRLTVIEIPLPFTLVRRVGQVNVVTLLRDGSALPLDPVVGILPLVNFGGITMSVEQTPATLNILGSGGHPAGIIYRPLTGGTQVPSTWSGGQVCFQRTAPVGMVGVSVVHEIEAAGCLPMDAYCSSGGCAAGVGRSIDLPDPAALAGG